MIFGRIAVFAIGIPPFKISLFQFLFQSRKEFLRLRPCQRNALAAFLTGRGKAADVVLRLVPVPRNQVDFLCIAAVARGEDSDFSHDFILDFFHQRPVLSVCYPPKKEDYRLSRFRFLCNSRSRSRRMVSSICFGVVPLGKYFRSLSIPIFTVSLWFAFSSVIIAKMVSMSSRPIWLNFFMRCACEREGVASSLSIVIRRFSCSSFFKKDSSTAGVRAICPSSTICKIGGINSVRRIYRCTVVFPIPKPCATVSSVRNFVPTWDEVKSVRYPCLFIASNFILYAKALSLGRIFSLWILLSTRVIIALSRSKGKTKAGIVSIPASCEARTRRCPAMTSYPFPPSFGRVMMGVTTPNSLMLSAISISSSSSTRRNGLSGNGCKSSIFSTVKSCFFNGFPTFLLTYFYSISAILPILRAGFS